MVTAEPTPAGATRRVLVVDDEATLVAALRYTLESEGYEVLAADRGDRALALATAERPDLVILDIMLPAVDGFEVCRLLRKESSVPILMLTAKTHEVDKIVGLEIGADDYMTKPFSMRELLARVRAMLRRSRMIPVENPPPAEALVVGDLTLDLKRQQVSRDSVPLALKPRELQLLLFFAQHPGQVFTRTQLLDQVWGYDFEVATRTVDVHVRWLREKIEQDPGSPRRIRTVRGIGYLFEV